MNDPGGSRRQALMDGLDLAGQGLEIAPLFRPTVTKAEARVLYTDYTTTEALREREQTQGRGAEVVDIDFVWTPGRRLADCAPEGQRFDWAIASHVVEHVPNPVGWIADILEVLKPGGVLSLAVPDMHRCFDLYRRETGVAEMLDAWMRQQSQPSPRQIFDCLSHAVDTGDETGGHDFDRAIPLDAARRMYTDEQALAYAAGSWSAGTYLDVHCSAWTPAGFHHALSRLAALGVLDIRVSEPVPSWGEFFCRIVKLGEGSIQPPDPYREPPPDIPAVVADDSHLERIAMLEQQVATLEHDLAHARGAFHEAVAIQQQLQARIAVLSRQPDRRSLWGRLRGSVGAVLRQRVAG